MTLKYMLSAKKSEENFFKNELNRVNLDIINIEENITKESKKYIHDNSNNVISDHPHFKEKHEIETRKESYYDYDWYKETYGVRNPLDSFGLKYDYKGPDRVLYTYCKECEVYFNKEYRAEDNEFSGEEIFKNGILKIEQKKLEKLFRGY